MPSQSSVIFVLGAPGAGKSTLCNLITKTFPVQHISVGDLLRRIKNDASHAQAKYVASMLNKQELMDAKILVPILRASLEDLESHERGNNVVVLIDGFPRNLSQLREFEEVFAEPILVLLFDCPKHLAKQRYLARNLKGREADDEAMFEKRYDEYVQENNGIVGMYRRRGILVDIDTSVGQEESWDKLNRALREVGVFLP